MYRILICDDDRDIVAALKIYLSGGEYQLYAAYTGKEALDIVQREDIQLILMDIMMPELDGIAATAKIREVSNVPIILLTAKSETSDKILGLNIGADDYITKPFDPMEVLARVRSPAAAVHQSRQRQRLPGRHHHRRGVVGRPGQDRHRGRRAGFSDAQRVRHSAAFDAASGTGLLLGQDL